MPPSVIPDKSVIPLFVKLDFPERKRPANNSTGFVSKGPLKGKGELCGIIIFQGDGIGHKEINDHLVVVAVFQDGTGSCWRIGAPPGLAEDVIGTIRIPSSGRMAMGKSKMTIFHRFLCRGHVLDPNPEILNPILVNERDGGHMKVTSEEIFKESGRVAHSPG